jgi:hypothetical protein
VSNVKESDGTTDCNKKDAAGTFVNQVDAPVCLTEKVEAAAIPFVGATTTRHPGCKRGFGWFNVPQSECGVAPYGCVRFEVNLLERSDPPWGITDP